MKNIVKKALVLLLLVIAAAGCGKKQEADSQADPEKITNVEIFTVKPSQFRDYINLPVVVLPNKEVNLGITGGGKVVKLHADKGDRVKQNMVLLETDDVMLKAQFNVAQANLEYQEKESARSEKLFKDGSITEAVHDATKLQLSQAQSAFEISKKQLEDAVLEAPFDGVITQRHVEVGDILGPGTPAFRIIDISRVKVQAGIPEKYITDFKVGNDVEVKLDAIPGKVFRGKINYIAPEANSSVRTFQAEIVVDNREGLIRAGIMGNASILRMVYNDSLMIPINALIETQNGRIVYVARNDNTAEKRSVEMGPAGTTDVMILSGIFSGDRVIVKGQHDLVEGEKINITGEYTAAGREGTGQ
ncbi:efflux RND transporter periplasmic adaptor subunit [bacterium]|nr:efflux RND transporter periplasmic adaptor subunit [bacterium]